MTDSTTQIKDQIPTLPPFTVDDVEVSRTGKRFYALRKGNTTSSCIYLLEHDFKKQIDNCSTAEYAIFSSMNEAIQYIESDSFFVVRSNNERGGGVTNDNDTGKDVLIDRDGNDDDDDDEDGAGLMNYEDDDDDDYIDDEKSNIIPTTSAVAETTTKLTTTAYTTSTGTMVPVYQSASNPSSSPNRPTKKTIKWDENFAELLKFKIEHGHLNLGSDSDLGKWCEKQINNYRIYKRKGTGPLTDEQVRRLKDIGLDLVPISEKRFYSNIEDLKKYKEENRDYEVPLSSNLYKFIGDNKKYVSIF